MCWPKTSHSPETSCWESDFVEGVRAQLVDRDHAPRWWHARVEDVPRELVLGKFAGGPLAASDDLLAGIGHQV